MSTLVIDTSALVAIALFEADRALHIAQIEQAHEILISPMNYVELGLVLIARRHFPSRGAMDEWLEAYRIRIARDPVIDAAALDAYLRFGKGRHPAKLNLADCFAYALAKALDAPLLYKGDDFSQTDVRPAL
ncbi:type II toxin-antitoxin system VapC family toxin [Caulobacter sp. 1776]|uniref:type II toxin-antitoxin system VapC family toxin n=1 Tax=Caulobacter sp. 1776 TaxID=3156420 RepID=UPI0033913A87